MNHTKRIEKKVWNMTLPEYNNSVWAKLITGKITREFKLFAVKVLISELRLTFLAQPTEATLRTCARQLHAFFKFNKHNPRAFADLMKIFN